MTTAVPSVEDVTNAFPTTVTKITGMLPGGCSPGKRCHTFLTMNIVLLHVVLAKVHCVPKNTLCELYGVKFSSGTTRNS